MTPELPKIPPDPSEWAPAMPPAPPVPSWLWGIIGEVLPGGAARTRSREIKVRVV